MNLVALGTEKSGEPAESWIFSLTSYTPGRSG